MKKVFTEEDFRPQPCGVAKKVVVIGGGVTGALSAFELARAGHQVTLIEAGGLGNGSSSRSAACIRQQFGTPSTVKGMIYCTAFYKNWAEIMGDASKISPMISNGYLFLKAWGAKMSEVEALVDIQHKAGLSDVCILSKKELEGKFPYLETTGLECATWCPSDGFLDPVIVYADAAEKASKHGATILQNEEVSSVEFDGAKAVGVKTKSGKVFHADIFVNAAGVWSPRISSMFDGYHLDIKAHRRYLYYLEGFKEEGEQGDFLLDAKDFHNLPMIITPRDGYCRPQGNQLMMGWAHKTKPSHPVFGEQGIIEPGFGINADNSYGEALRKEIGTYLPDAIKGGKMRNLSSVASGFYEDTPDHNPFIGYDPWVSNLIHAAGFSGHGLMHAPFSALLVSNLVNENKDLDVVKLPLDLGPVDVKTFHLEREFKTSESMVI